MTKTTTIFMRELSGYFETPVAYVCLVVFLLLSSLFTFYIGNFYEAGQANLDTFFMWLPWLFLFLIPAISMRLWAEERKSGTIELLATLPLKSWEVVLGKYLAAWAFAAVALILTFPIWLTVNYLGNPDNGAIIAGYIASILVAGGFLAIGSAMSAFTSNQVIAFVMAVALCFIFNVAGLTLVLDFFSALGFSQTLLDTISSFSLLTHFIEMNRGVISLANVIYFLSLISFWLFVNVLVIEGRR